MRKAEGRELREKDPSLVAMASIALEQTVSFDIRPCTHHPLRHHRLHQHHQLQHHDHRLLQQHHDHPLQPQRRNNRFHHGFLALWMLAKKSVISWLVECSTS